MSEFDVKRIRTKIGITQKELAEKIGITQRAVQKWEAGGVVPESKKKMLLSLLPTEDELNSYHTNGSHSSQAVGAGVDMETVAKILGHSTTRVTRSTYAKLLDDTVGREMEKAEEKER